jgi:DNA-binding Xre family transcriptional regulator
MIKLNIDEAIRQYVAKTGLNITRSELADIAFPGITKKFYRHTRLKQYESGAAKTVELDAVFRICNALNTDPNSLMSWKK